MTGSVGRDLRKNQLVEFLRPNRESSFSVRRRRLTFGARGGLAAVAARGGGGGADGKVVIERLCLSLPHVEKPFNSKVIKSFVPEKRSRKWFFFCVSGFLCYLYVRYEHSMYISRIWVQSAGPIECTDWISVEGLRPTNECPRYNTKPFDGQVLVLKLWGIWSTSSLPLVPVPF